MKIVAALSWYREDPDWLHETVTSLRKAGVSHLVALDGAYALYPGGTPSSHPAEYRALEHAADRAGIGLTIETPPTVWQGGEIEKRTRLFALANEHCVEGEDWIFIIDGDEVIIDAPEDLHQVLAGSPFDVAQATYVEFDGPDTMEGRFPRRFQIPKFFRAQPITVVGNHFTYRTDDGRLLWGNALRSHLEPRIPLDDVFLIEHRTWERERKRHENAHAYYAARERHGIERGTCDRCRVRRSVWKWWTDWRPHEFNEDGEPVGFSGLQVELCDSCMPLIAAENRATCQRLGVWPDLEPVRLGFDRHHDPLPA